jgi:UDP-3-O-[3-hydroxymyristoyl] glucosamine N-acyltransferase
MEYYLSQIAEKIGARLEGEDKKIKSLATLKDADKNSLSFFHSSKYYEDLKKTKAAGVLISKDYQNDLPQNVSALICDDPYLKFAYASALFAPKISLESTPPALGDGAKVDESVRFGKNVKIGKNSIIMAGCYLGDNVRVGDDCIIYPNVTIYHGCKIKNRVIIHSGAVIGADGFGFAHNNKGEHIKIYQLGAVEIESDVEVGANTTIDRGALGDTFIGRGTKIDNLVQIGHNAKIGPNSIIVAGCAIAGSAELGRNVVLGGQSAVAGHLKIGDMAQFAARSGVTKSMEGGKIYAGAPAMEIRLWRRLQAVLARLAKKGYKKDGSS